MPRKAKDGSERQDEGLYDFLLTDQGKRWLAGVIRREQELRGDAILCPCVERPHVCGFRLPHHILH